MSTPAKPTKPPGAIEQIKVATSHDEVDRISAEFIGRNRRNDRALRLVNRAAVKRHEELSKP